MKPRLRNLSLLGGTLLAMTLLAGPPLEAATIVVTSTSDCFVAACDGGLTTLPMAIFSLDLGSNVGDAVAAGAYGTNDTILFAFGSYPQTINLGANTDYLPIQTDMAIIGPIAGSVTINQTSAHRVLFVNPGIHASISNLTFSGGNVAGGVGGNGALNGGGGGAGMGGGMFVDTGAVVDLDTVTFDSNQALGGNGGDGGSDYVSYYSSGGGGGVDGNPGSDGNSANGDGGTGGNGFGPVLGGTPGLQTGCTAPGDGGNGAGGGGTAECTTANGGAGGFGGGGGGSSPDLNSNGGKGGFGGGGGAFSLFGNGGEFGGSGGFPDYAGGGGGAGLGGAIFVRDGATLNLSNCTFTNNGSSGGIGGAGGFTPATNGEGKGGAIFAMDSATVTEICASVYSGNTADNQENIATVYGSLADNNDVYGTLTKGDSTNPIITCPPDKLGVPNTPGLCSAVVDPGTATATDSCAASVTVKGVRSDALLLTDPYPVGTTFISWTATDSEGNTDVCLQTITVKDTENPVLTCTGNQTASADASCQAAVPNFVVSVTDNCPGAVAVQVPPAGTLVGKGVTNITVTATDAAGNSVSCTPTFTVNDTTPPVVTSSEVIHILSSDHTMKDVIFSASAVDNCDGALDPTVEIYSNENEELKTSSGDARTSPDAKGLGTNYNYNQWYNRIFLRQERTNNGQGRVYLIKVSATDLSGNTGYSCTYVISPKSSKRQDVQKAQTLGDAVVGPCNATGLVPLNYLLNPVGFGPVIGNKQ